MTVRQFLCGVWTGHDRVFRFENRDGLPCRVLLHCTNCQHSTPGLAPRPVAYRQTYAGDPQRHRLSMRDLLHISKRRAL